MALTNTFYDSAYQEYQKKLLVGNFSYRTDFSYLNSHLGGSEDTVRSACEMASQRAGVPFQCPDQPLGAIRSSYDQALETTVSEPRQAIPTTTYIQEKGNRREMPGPEFMELDWRHAPLQDREAMIGINERRRACDHYKAHVHEKKMAATIQRVMQQSS